MLESQNILHLQRRQRKPRISTKCLVHGRAIDIMNINDVYGPSRRQAHGRAARCLTARRADTMPCHSWKLYQGNRKLRARCERCVAFCVAFAYLCEIRNRATIHFPLSTFHLSTFHFPHPRPLNPLSTSALHIHSIQSIHPFSIQFKLLHTHIIHTSIIFLKIVLILLFPLILFH